MSAMTPLPNHHCPICNGPNNCAPAQTGSFGQPCWCDTAEFPPGLLDRVPPQLRGKACVCATCAREHAVQQQRQQQRA